MQDKIREVVKSYVELRTNIKAVEEKVKKAKKKLEEYKAVIITHLEENSQKSLGYEDLGAVTLVIKEQYAYPKELEKVRAFNSWLVKTRGPDYVVRNLVLSAANVRNCVMEERDNLQTAEERATFLPPGIEPPFGVVSLSYRKPKKK